MTTTIERFSNEYRRTHLGASQIPAICGVSPYERPIEVFQRVKGLLPWGESSEASDLGHMVEPGLIAWAARREGIAMTHNTTTYEHPRLPWLCFTPDGLAREAPNVIGANAKSMGLASYQHDDARERWGPEGTDEVPVAIACQVQAEMLIARALGWGSDEWLVPALIAGRGRVLYRVRYDELVASEIVGRTEKFWHDTQNNEPPPPDGSEAFSKFLEDRFRIVRKPAPVEGHEVDEMIDEFFNAADEFKRAETRKENARQRALLLIGDAPGAKGAKGRVTHIRSDGKEGFRQQELHRWLTTMGGLTPDEAMGVIKSCTKRGEPYSTVRGTPAKEKTT